MRGGTPIIFIRLHRLQDYEFTLTCPWRLTADTGIDALCHAMEAYVSRRANWFSDSLALAAVATIGKNIRGACAEEPAAREAMMLASMQAGYNRRLSVLSFLSVLVGHFRHCILEQFGHADSRHVATTRGAFLCPSRSFECHAGALRHQVFY